MSENYFGEDVAARYDDDLGELGNPETIRETRPLRNSPPAAPHSSLVSAPAGSRCHCQRVASA